MIDTMQTRVVYSNAGSLLVGGGACATTALCANEMFGEPVWNDPSEQIILIHSWYPQCLSDGHLAAMIAHERAHIALGHVTIAFKDWKPGDGFYSDETFEVAADQCAAGVVGKKTYSELFEVVTEATIMNKIFRQHVMDQVYKMSGKTDIPEKFAMNHVRNEVLKQTLNRRKAIEALPFD